jgi:hypothetical protein
MTARKRPADYHLGPDVDRERCRICGEVISCSRVFFRDDPPGNGWVHRDCLFAELRREAEPRS